MQRLIFTAIVGPNLVYAEGLRRILLETRYRVVKDASMLGSAKSSKGSLRDALILMRAESDQDLVATVRDHKSRYSRAKIAVFGEKCDASQIVSAIGAGVDGFIDDSMNVEVLVKSLDLVMLHQKVVPTWFLENLCPRQLGGVELNLDQSTDLAALPPTCVIDCDDATAQRAFSTREKDVLTCLMRGETNKNIARHLNMAEATVKVHVKAILRRVSAKNRTQAALWATNHRWPLSDAGTGNGQ